MLVRNAPGIEDYRFLPSVTVQPAARPFRFVEPAAGQPYAWQHAVDTFRVYKHGNTVLPLIQQLQQQGAVGLVVLHRDTVKYMRTWRGVEDTSMVTSFSIAKGFVNTMVGLAVQDGFLKNIDQPVTDYLPELAPKGFGNVTIRHLMQMTSCIDRPNTVLGFFWEAGIMYYTPNLERSAERKRVSKKHIPGTYYEYLNTNTQLLAVVLERATHQPLEQYFQHRLWQPLGAEHALVWSTDRRDTTGMPKAFCCLNARMLDFAKYGRLYAHYGHWNGHQLVDTAWVQAAFAQRKPFMGKPNYNHHWQPSSRWPGMYRLAGLYGQYILVVPELELVIVHFARQNLTADAQWILSMDQLLAAMPIVQRHMAQVAQQWPNALTPERLVPNLLPDSAHARHQHRR
jgi:CubicO group peptidase (beta-lactamase class C family)